METPQTTIATICQPKEESPFRAQIPKEAIENSEVPRKNEAMRP